MRVAKLPMAAVLRTRTTGETQGFMKALVDASDDRILGFTMIGPEAGEVMAVVQTAMLAGLPYTACATRFSPTRRWRNLARSFRMCRRERIAASGERPPLKWKCDHDRSFGKDCLGSQGSRGIGRASALALAKAGARVVVHYSRGAKEAEAVVREICAAGGRADAISVDLAATDGAHRLAKQVRGLVGDRLDILVPNAGVPKSTTIEDTTIEDFDRLFAVNVRAPFFLVQQLLPILGSGSSIIFVSSLVAHAAVGTIARLCGHQGGN